MATLLVYKINYHIRNLLFHLDSLLLKPFMQIILRLFFNRERCDNNNYYYLTC